MLSIPQTIIDDLTTKVTALAAKYETSLMEVEQKIDEASKDLSSMLRELTGAEFDMQAYGELEKLLNR